MTALRIAVAAAFLFACSREAAAVVVAMPGTPASLKESPGLFAVTVERRDDGLLRFTITHRPKGPRYLATTLDVRRDGELLASSHSPAYVREASATWYAVVSPKCVAESTFEVSERRFVGTEGQPLPLPGGIDYRFRLAEFVTPDAPAATP